MQNQKTTPAVMVIGDAVWGDAAAATPPNEYVVAWQGRRGFRAARHVADTPKAIYDAYRAHPPADLDAVTPVIEIHLAADLTDFGRKEVFALAPHPTPLPGQPEA